MTVFWEKMELGGFWSEVSALDECAFDALVKEYQNRIGKYLYRLIGNFAGAQDLTQEVFFRAYKARGQLRSQESIVSWLFSIATNLAKDYHRRKGRFSFVPWEPEIHDQEIAESPTELLGEKDLVRTVMNRLPDEAVRCLLLHEVEGFTSREIAKILGIKADAARQRIVRARKLFKQAYETLSTEEQP